MVMKIKRDSRLITFENIVLDFAEEGGSFLSYSDDAIFNRMLKETLYKILQVKKECVFTTTDRKYALNVLSLKAKSRLSSIVFIERSMAGKSTLEFFEFVRASFSDIHCIALTSETDKSELALLHEAGADNIITKPLNMNTLIEKIAFTVRPQGHIGQMIEKGKQLVVQGEYQAALKVADAILADKSNSAAALMVKGDAYRGLNRTDQAAAEYFRAHECAQMYLEPLKRLAALYEELGDDAKQLSFLDKLDELSPLNVARKMRIGGLHMAMGDEEKGKQTYARAMEVATREAAQNASNVAMDIAERLLGVDAEAAETFYRKALSLKGRHLDRSDVETFNRLGIALRRQKRPKAAITEYTRALGLAPDDENLYYNMAMAHLEAGDYQLARSRVEKVLKLNRSFARHSQVLSYNVGMIYYKNGEADTGTAYFKQALELDPGYRPARQMLEKIATG